LIFKYIAKIYEIFHITKRRLIYLLTTLCFLLTKNTCGFKVIIVFLFACSNRQSQTVSQAEQTSTVNTPDVSGKGEEVKDITADVQTAPESENKKANEDKTTVVETNTVSESKEKPTPKIMSYHQVDVQPLFNGKRWIPEFKEYINQNQKLLKISEEAGIKEEWMLGCTFFIDTVGSVVDISPFFNDKGQIDKDKMNDPSFQLLADEMVRLVSGTQGKWMPAIHKGEKIKVQIVNSFSNR